MIKNKIAVLIVLMFVCLVFSQCENSAKPPVQDLLGITIGADRKTTREHLEKTGFFVRDDRRRQELWEFRNNKNYNNLSIGYDKNDKVRYLTAFAHRQIKADGATNSKISALIKTEPIRYDQFGDLSKAKQNVFMGDKEYVWEIAANGDVPSYFIIVRGIDPTFANSCTFVATSDQQRGGDLPLEENKSANPGAGNQNK
ncbi:MAG: hypothetical protein H7Z37_03795 [Pyrinomonadaceae bacterium]|nr:hypothetical protein [Pyrinomonadaceae bacterium]